MCTAVAAVKGRVYCCGSSEGLCTVLRSSEGCVCTAVAAVKGRVYCCGSSEGLCTVLEAVKHCVYSLRHSERLCTVLEAVKGCMYCCGSSEGLHVLLWHKHSTTLILPPLLKPPSRRICLITISKLFFTALPIPSSDTLCVCVCVCACVRACLRACMRERTCMRACVCVCVVSVIVKRPVLPPSAVDGRSRNPLYCYYCTVLEAVKGCVYGCRAQWPTSLSKPGSKTTPCRTTFSLALPCDKTSMMSVWRPVP